MSAEITCENFKCLWCNAHKLKVIEFRAIDMICRIRTGYISDENKRNSDLDWEWKKISSDKCGNHNLLSILVCKIVFLSSEYQEGG